ncbi:hypothetical protein F5B17DRAFT_451613 [Nemania serpens]|nr:hypothetical protein F5B17DRAFT_451613 [Nemania serpens]
MARLNKNQRHMYSLTDLRGTPSENMSFVSTSDISTNSNPEELRGILRSTTTPPSPAPIASTRGPSWGWEYTALSLSVFALPLLLAFLAYIDNMRLSHWKLPVPPTAVVSIIAAIARAPLGFAISSCLAQAKWNWFKKRSDSPVAFDRLDDASRGPWGSLWLVLWVKARHMVAVGAAATVLILTFDPFLQAVVSFNGSIASSEGTIPAYLSRNTEFVSALYSGFYSSRAAGMQTVLSTCPTANCSWTLFTTLAMCSECHDVTSYMKRSEYQSAGAFLENAAGPLEPATGTSMSAQTLLNHLYNLSFKNLTTMITTVQVIRAAEDYEKGEVAWADANVSATECALWFCVNAYKSSMKQGKLEEVLIGSWSERDFDSYADISGLGDRDSTRLFDEMNNYSFVTPHRFDTIRSDLRLLIAESEIQRLHLPENVTTSFNITANTIVSVTRFINNDFFSPEMNPGAQSLWSSTNLSDTFNNAARSLTKWIRDASNAAHRGETQEWTTTVQIEWQYITAPLAAFVAGVLFCLFICWETARLGLPPWKTGMIATLTHSLDATTREQLRSASKDGSLDKVAKATVVQLEDVGSGLEMKVKRI